MNLQKATSPNMGLLSRASRFTKKNISGLRAHRRALSVVDCVFGWIARSFGLPLAENGPAKGLLGVARLSAGCFGAFFPVIFFEPNSFFLAFCVVLDSKVLF